METWLLSFTLLYIKLKIKVTSRMENKRIPNNLWANGILISTHFIACSEELYNRPSSLSETLVSSHTHTHTHTHMVCYF